MLRTVRTRALMSTYLMTVPTYGTFVISEGVLTKVVGLATDGRVVQDYASWETARQFWRKFRRICAICLVAPILYIVLFVDMKHQSAYRHGHVDETSVLVTLMVIFGPIIAFAWQIGRAHV